MINTIIYSGFLRTWDKVKENQEKNLWKEGDEVIFYTEKAPEWNKEHKFYPIQDQLDDFSRVLATNAAPETHILNTLNQWRNRYYAFSRILHNTPIFIVSRTDIKFSGKLNFGQQYETIYIPQGNDYREGINDQFAYGGYREMRHYCDLYLHYKTYFNEGLQFHPETYLKRHLRDIEIIRTPVTNQIIR